MRSKYEIIERNNKNFEGCYYPIPYKYSKYLFYSSFTMSLTALIALYFDEGVTSFYYFILFLTSINFWRKPEYGLRRNIDITVVYMYAVYTILNIFLLKHEFHRVFLLAVFLSVNLYNLVEYILYYFGSPKWIIFHMAMHIYVSFGIFLIILD
jgi:hypothetical protein